jgi:NADP-dependent 3-hydroxy acid dehydrogenase YdfG
MELTTDGVFVITGGAGALAGEVARVLREAGARLVLADLDSARLWERAAALDAIAVVADLTSQDDADRMAAEAERAHGRIDGLIHTAGGFARGAVHEVAPGAFDRMFDLNVRTLHLATRAVLPGMLRRRSGFIAGISTSLVWHGTGGAGMALYAAAKAAVTFYLRSLEREVRASDVRVAVVYPLAPIDTPANRADMPGADPDEWVDPAEIAAALLFAATRGQRGRVLELPIASGR